MIFFGVCGRHAPAGGCRAPGSWRPLVAGDQQVAGPVPVQYVALQRFAQRRFRNDQQFAEVVLTESRLRVDAAEAAPRHLDGQAGLPSVRDDRETSIL